jgi:hypothetical protein
LADITVLQEASFRSEGTWAAVLNVWFVVWAIRRKGELDYKLDGTAKGIRWLIVLLFLGTAVQAPWLLNPPSVRLCVGFIGLGFLVWPNLAYHLTGLLRRCKLLRNSDAEELDQTTRL